MPIVIPKDIPAYETLEKENIFVMSSLRADTQDIRPIEIVIVNLMPTKIVTETQLMRLLSNSPLQVNITLLNTATYSSKNTEQSYLDKFYKTFDEIKDKQYDGMIITGAPVENFDFEDVLYWDELKNIMDFAEKKVTSTIYICWGAQAALYHYYGIPKYMLDDKLFGVYKHRKCVEFSPLLKGLDDIFYIPHSRHSAVDSKLIYDCKYLEPLAESDETGIAIFRSIDDKKIFITGHLEYDKNTLKQEYERDLAKGLDIHEPDNYFSKTGEVLVRWRSTANIIFSNWLNYFVYQVTPYDIDR
ncbi:MAG: homoserine O-succinyltransferase [Bacilli bacterium]|jgi:homoserine O-succinyltransferase